MIGSNIVVTPRLAGPVSDPQRSRPKRQVEVEVDEEEATSLDEPWHVILFNDEEHAFEEVIWQLIRALKCDQSTAARYAWTAHVEGKANVFAGTFEECFRVQSILKEIELITEIRG